MNSPVLTIISFLIIFTVVVVSHEFGHFLIARINGIRVLEFSIGMGPVIFRKKGKNTDLTIRLLPFGGACMYDGMYDIGEDDDEDGNADAEGDSSGTEESVTEEKASDSSDEAQDEVKGEKSESAYRDGEFNAAPVWGRIAAIFAGPLFNIILAYILGLFIVWFCGADLPIVADVSEGMPAMEAGIEAGDEIISINGHRTYLWREIMVRSFMSTGGKMNIVYERNGERRTAELTPKWSDEDKRYYIGFSGGGDYIACNNLRVFQYSWYEVRYWLDATIQGLKYMVTGHASVDDLSGPVGIANVIDDTIEDTKQDGAFVVILNMVNIALLLSVNLGVMNLLPLPALDGGRLLFLFFEAISGKKVPPGKEGLIHLIGFILLIILMVVVLYNDITKFFR
ncbi:MAG: RIP metalloprotease RseP [Lachnospiraceae bacterium]|nr:RIP metalloprotease RseP [Lachnospiraceae bacterium]